MHDVLVVLIVAHAATVVPANGAIPAGVVEFAPLNLKRKNQNQELHNVRLLQKKEANVVEPLR